MLICPVCLVQNQDAAKYCTGCGFELAGAQPLMPHSVLQGRYRILEQIGGGGMSTVYRALDTRLSNASRAIKGIKPTRPLDADARYEAIESFGREAAILAHLEHPNLPRIYDHFSEGGRQYLVMDYIDGWTLRWIIEHRPDVLKLDRVVNRILQLCDVLTYLHSQTPPIIFRDLKPENVMVARAGTIKLIDFGIARFFLPRKTRDTTSMGTQGYAAPEQYGQTQTDARSDIYSLGVVFHEMLTLHDPTETPFALPAIHDLVPGVPQAIATIIQRATSLDPEGRFSSASEFKEALRQAGATSGGLHIVDMGSRPQTESTRETELSQRTEQIRTATVRGRTCMAESDLEQAIMHFTEAIDLGTIDDAIYGERGVAYLRTGQLALALADFDQAIKRNPTTPYGYFFRGLTYQELNQLEKAVTDYEMALTLDPTLQEAYYNKGLISLNQGNNQQAFNDFSRVLVLDPGSVGAYYHRGLACLDIPDLEQAIADFDQMNTMDPGDADAHYWRGVALGQQGKLGAAVDAYCQAITIDPRHVNALHDRGITYAQLDMLDEALADLTRVIEINPKSLRAFINRGLVHGQNGEYLAAVADFSEAISLDPQADSAYYNRGVTYRAMGESDKAISDFGQAIARNPQNPDAYICRGFLHMANDENEQAIRDLESALTLKLDPHWQERVERSLAILRAESNLS